MNLHKRTAQLSLTLFALVTAFNLVIAQGKDDPGCYTMGRRLYRMCTPDMLNDKCIDNPLVKKGNIEYLRWCGFDANQDCVCGYQWFDEKHKSHWRANLEEPTTPSFPELF